MDIRGQSTEDRRFMRPEPAGAGRAGSTQSCFSACPHRDVAPMLRGVLRGHGDCRGCSSCFRRGAVGYPPWSNCVVLSQASPTTRTRAFARGSSQDGRRCRHPKRPRVGSSTYGHGFVAIRSICRGLIPGFRSDRRTPYLASDLKPWMTASSRDCRIGLIIADTRRGWIVTGGIVRRSW